MRRAGIGASEEDALADGAGPRGDVLTSESALLPVPLCTLAVRPSPSKVVVVKWLLPPVFGVVAVMVQPVEA